MDYNSQINTCRNFLKQHDTGILASSSVRAEPHASLVNYLVDDKYHIYFMAREGAHKYKNITVNSAACLVVCSDNFSNSVEVKGMAYKIKDGSHTNDMLTRLATTIRRNNPGPLPILHHPGSEIYLFRLEPNSFTYADFYTSHNTEGQFFEVRL